MQQALTNFFQPEKILQLRELALKEVAGQVERKVDYEVTVKEKAWRHEHFLACISSNHEMAQRIIRKTARLASYYNSKWYVLYVQTPKESSDKIPLADQRHLINNFKNATELGAEVIQKNRIMWHMRSWKLWKKRNYHGMPGQTSFKFIPDHFTEQVYLTNC